MRLRLANLEDNRRANKPWLPADDRDVTNGLVVKGPGQKWTPHCARHGAMNRVDPVWSFWRCSEFRCGVGAQLMYDGNSLRPIVCASAVEAIEAGAL